MTCASDYLYDLKANNLANPLAPDGSAILQMSGVNPSSQSKLGAVYRWTGSNIELIEMSGVGQTLTVFGRSRLNSFGDAAFHGWATFSTTRSIWHEGGRSEPVVVEGDLADGVTGSFSEFIAFSLADDNRVIVHGALGADEKGVWKEDQSGTLRKVVAVGDDAPGLDDGFTFYRVNNVATNRSGRIAVSDLAVSSLTSAETAGLWTGDENGLSLVVSGGDPVTVAEGDTRIVEYPNVGGPVGEARTGADGHPSTINDGGDVLFSVEFATGQGSAVMVASSGLVVNSTADRSDADDVNGDGILSGGEESDGTCDTGETILRDDGSEEAECTYRAAITGANAIPGQDRITFDIPGAAPYVIEPEKELPAITEAVTVAGPVGPDLAGKAARAGDPPVWISGKLSSGGASGQVIESLGVTLRNLIIVNWPGDGILLRDTSSVVITGCLIGTDFSGSDGLGNGGYGIRSEGRLSESKVGGPSQGDGNVISGNLGGGIKLAGDVIGVTIAGNIIGLNPQGNAKLGNQGVGVAIEGGLAATIGGMTFTPGQAPGNVISSNAGGGVVLLDTDGTKIVGNLIGTNGSGDSVGQHIEGRRYAFSNGSIGVSVTGTLNSIGQGASYRNVIAGHEVNVKIELGSTNVVYGNIIGLDITGTRFLPSGTGIYVLRSNDNTLGGAAEGRGNHIAFGDSDGAGIRVVLGRQNEIRNNHIGIGANSACPLDVNENCALGDFGIRLFLANRTVIDGNFVGNSGGSGLSLLQADSTEITLNRIGTDPSGMIPAPNALSGIVLSNSSRNFIGGENAGNLVSGNRGSGIHITGSTSFTNHITDNLIGVAADGNCPGGDPCRLGNGGAGIVLDDSTFVNEIAFNQISGNALDGIRIRAASDNSIENNLIGTDATGMAKIPNQKNGIWIEEGANNNIGSPSDMPSNVISGNNSSGILIRGVKSVRNVVINNLIGTTKSGTGPLGNKEGGVVISDAPGNEIGGRSASRLNVISDNGFGVAVNKPGATENVIVGNYIGTDMGGTAALGNKNWGIVVQDAAFTIIGDSTSAGRNVIAKNGESGVLLNNPGTTQTRILGNFVGLGADGAMLGNGGSGIEVRNGAHTNQIGGARPGDRNVISANEASGVLITGPTAIRNTVAGNFIGVDTTGTLDYGNRDHGVMIENAPRNKIGDLAGNVISGNDQEGILVQGSGTGLTIIVGNQIGTDWTGTRKVGNGRSGVALVGAREVFVGDRTPASSGNLISGNVEHGVFVGGSRTSIVIGNLIGTDSTGSASLSNGKDGVRILESSGITVGGDAPGSSLCSGRCNVISGNQEHGVTVAGDKSLAVDITGNYIGTDRTGQENLANVGRGVNIIGGSHGVVGGRASKRNLVAYHGGTVSEQRNAGVALVGVDHWSVTNNQIQNNNAGVLLLNATGNTVASNRIVENECGIEQIGTREDVNLLEINFVANNSGECTGIRTVSGRSLIRGNTITGDAGNGISIEGDAQPTILDNNIMGNAGFGVVTADEAFPIVATSNWWGDASGPGGSGPGLGQKVGGGIDYSNWRAEMVALVGAPTIDTLLVKPGRADTAVVLFRNWADPTDIVDVTFNDARDWLQQPSSSVVTLSDQDGGAAQIGIIVSETSGGATDLVVATAVSRADPSVTSVDSFYVAAYVPDLTSIVLQPDSVVAIPGDTVRFVAEGLDQLGDAFDFAPVWTATGGSVSESGVYVVGDLGGSYTVTAKDDVGVVIGTAAVFVPTSVGVENDQSIEETEAEVPKAFALFQSYPNPFNPTTTIEFDVAEQATVDLRVYDVSGREITVLVHGPKAPGRYSVFFNASDLPSGLYFYRIRMGEFSKTRKMILLR